MNEIRHGYGTVGAERPALEKSYTGIAPYYDETRYLNPKAGFTFQSEAARLRETILAHAPTRRRLLDAACGTDSSPWLLPTSSRPSSESTSPGTCSSGPGRRETSASDVAPAFVNASAEQLPIAPARVDVVMTTRFLHLFPREQHRRLLESLLAPLRTGDILVVEHDTPWLEWLLLAERSSSWPAKARLVDIPPRRDAFRCSPPRQDRRARARPRNGQGTDDPSVILHNHGLSEAVI